MRRQVLHIIYNRLETYYTSNRKYLSCQNGMTACRLAAGLIQPLPLRKQRGIRRHRKDALQRRLKGGRKKERTGAGKGTKLGEVQIVGNLMVDRYAESMPHAYYGRIPLCDTYRVWQRGCKVVVASYANYATRVIKKDG